MQYKNPDFSEYKRYYQNLEHLSNKPKTRLYSTAIFSFLAVSLFGWYAIRPTLQTILFLRREIADETEVNRQMETKISNLVQAQAAYQSAANELPLLDEAIPTNPDVISLVTQMRNLANQVDASVSAIQVGTVPVPAPEAPEGATSQVNGSVAKAIKLNLVPISFVLEGKFPAMKTYLENLLSMRRLVSIDSIDMQPSSDDIVTIGTPSSSLRVSVKGSAYFTDK